MNPSQPRRETVRGRNAGAWRRAARAGIKEFRSAGLPRADGSALFTARPDHANMGFLDRLRGRPSPDDFAAMMIWALTRAGAGGYRYDREEFRLLRVEDGKVAAVSNLSNMHTTYLGKPRGERAAYFRTCVRSALAPQRSLPEEFVAARPDLRAKVWSRAGLERSILTARLEGMGEGPNFPTVPLGEHLLMSVAFDWPESLIPSTSSRSSPNRRPPASRQKSAPEISMVCRSGGCRRRQS